jgi:hypothetical protein
MMILPKPIDLLFSAIATVADTQPELFKLRVGERAVTAQIGWALAALIMQAEAGRNWSVDLEYDRERIAGELKLRYDRKNPEPRSRAVNESLSFRLGVPDIVVHRRGLQGPDHNLLVVELKRTYVSLTSGSVDRMKVNEFMDRHGYQYGCIVGLGSRIGACDPQVSWRRLANRQWRTMAVSPAHQILDDD